MTRFISWIAMLIIGVVAVVFAVSNRSSVDVNLWPVAEELSVPLFVIALGAALLGFLGGAIVAWFSGGRRRLRARLARRQVTGMEKDLGTLRERIGDLEERQHHPESG